MWPIFLPAPGPRDWPEDASADDDNGCYQNTCLACKEPFFGHKHRPVCKTCDAYAKARWDALTPEQQAEETKRTSESIATFLAQL